MYSFTFRAQLSDSPVFGLAQSLKMAHDRGVRVEVILDQNYSFLEDEGGDFLEGKNAPAYQFLRAQGIPVFYDGASSYTHAKVVVIDENTVILGSTNWTDSALKRNVEANVLVRSKTLAQTILADIRAIPRQDPLPNYDDVGVAVPLAFLQNPDFFGRMVSRKDDRAFDVYLYLLKKQSELSRPLEESLTIKHEDLAVAVGIETSSRESYRRQVNRILGKLQKLYGLIDVHPEFNKDSVVTFREISIDRTVGEGVKIQTVHVPLSYWTWGWDRRLTFTEKGFFLISQYESSVSTRRPRWSAAQKTLARRYGASPWYFGEGAMGLRRRNLLEVDWAPFTDGPIPRLPTVYTPNTLYDPVELEKKLAEIQSKNGADKFERALKAAQTVYEDSDVNGIIELISLENQYGRERVEAAVKIIQQKNPDSPLRTMGYLIGTIRKIRP